jgi:signal transduction histidine kinase
MKKFFQSFYGKLSTVFLILLILLGSIQVLITTRSFRNFNREVDQRLNFNLARDMAFELTTLLGDSLDFERIGERIHYMMVMNPKIEIYLLDESGTILAFFAEPGKRVVAENVDLEPVAEFLSEGAVLPILGADPRQPGRQKPFSAATLNLPNGESGFLYIIIGGEQYDSTLAFLQDSYIVKTMINGLVLAVLFAALIGLILFALLTKRLRSISDVVAEFEKGNLENRIQLKASDEFGQLARSFNQMADTIDRIIEELKQNDTLRRELIANVSHDLRTPLASIIGYLETILMKTDLDNEQRQEYLQTIHRSAQSLNTLVGELFDLSKLEARQIEPSLEPVALPELGQDVIMAVQDLADRQSVKLKTDFQSGVPFAMADVALIERVLANLITNAIEYTPANGTVTLTILADNGAVRVEVADTGQGIAAEDLPHIFERFYRAGRKTVAGSTSTGLGLTIAQKIIQAHGRELKVTSNSNEGTRFHFSLSAS